MAKRASRTKVMQVPLDEPLRRREVEDGYDQVLLVPTFRGEVLGETFIRAHGELTVDTQRVAIQGEIADRFLRRRLEVAFRRATDANGQSADSRHPSTVSVVVCTRPGSEHGLVACLGSVRRLRRKPDEVIVVGAIPADLASRYAELGPRCIPEESTNLTRARNRGIVEARGEVIAFTGDGCSVDPGWLDPVDAAFSDSLVMVVAGYVGFEALESQADWASYAHAASRRSIEAGVDDFAARTPVTIDSRNVLIRRSAFEQLGLFREEAGGDGSPLGGEDAEFSHRVAMAGYRLISAPAHLVWQRDPGEYREVRRAVASSASGAAAHALRCLVRHGDAGPMSAALRRWMGLASRAGRTGARGTPRLPVGVVLAELAGALAGPWRLLRAVARPARTPPLQLLARPTRSPTVVGSEYPQLSVAIASYNRRDQLGAAIEALRDQSYPAERFEAVVVLDGSADGSAELVRAAEVPYSLRLIEQDNRGLGASRNRGAREAISPVLVFLDDDAMPAPDFLAQHAAAHKEAPHQHFVLGYTPPVVRDESLWSISIRNWWEDFFRRRREPGHRWTFMDVADGNSSIPRSLFFDCDGFDEGMERRHDWEFGARLLKRGVRFAHRQEAVAWHHFDTSFAAALRNRRQEGRADIPFAMRHPEAKGRLLLGNLAGLVGSGMSPRRALAYSHPEVSERLARAALPMLYLFEVLNLRRPWWRLSNMVLAHAYLLGVADAMPSLEDFRAFMTPIFQGEGAHTVDVELDRMAPLALPAEDAGWLRLVLRLAGKPVATVVTPEPGSQWDWGSLTERVVQECASGIGQALGTAESFGEPLAFDLSLRTSG